MSEKTYPCLVRGRIMELTAAQRDAIERRSLPPEARIADLEREVAAMRVQLAEAIAFRDAINRIGRQTVLGWRDLT